MESKSILLTGKIVAGEICWNIPPLPVDEEEPEDGLLQDMIDIAHADMLAEEWQEFWMDESWLRGGC